MDSENYCPVGYDYSKSNSAKRYGIMRDALQAQNRTILYSLCSWGTAGVEQYGNETGNSWRMSDDITRKQSHKHTASSRKRQESNRLI